MYVCGECVCDCDECVSVCAMMGPPLPPVFNTVAGPATTTQQMRIPNDVSDYLILPHSL